MEERKRKGNKEKGKVIKWQLKRKEKLRIGSDRRKGGREEGRRKY